MKSIKLTINDDDHARLSAAAAENGYPTVSGYLLSLVSESEDQMPKLLALLSDRESGTIKVTDLITLLSEQPLRGEISALGRRFKFMVDQGRVPGVKFAHFGSSNHAVYTYEKE